MRQSVVCLSRIAVCGLREAVPGLVSADDSAGGANLPRGLQFGKLAEKPAPIVAAYAWANIETPALPISESCAQMAPNARRKRMPRQRIKALHAHEELVKSVKPLEQVHRTKDVRALLIEDDKDTAQFVCKGLKEHGYVVDCASEGKEGLYLATTEKYDVLIVDRMLPGLDGLSVVKTLRAAGNNAPAIFLTTMSGIDDRVEGLDAGADDYLTKPFALPELLARLSALLRRPPLSETKTVLRAADLEMDLLKRSVRRAGKTIDLQPQEFRILEYLMRSEGRVVTRTMLLENVWDFHFDPLTSVVETHISRLRAKIDKGFKSPLVRTVRGVGYSLRNDV